MKTREQVKELYKSETLDGRDLIRLMNFFPTEDWAHFGIGIKDGVDPSQIEQPKEWTKENILVQLEKDVEFGFEKALDQRGLSAGAMYNVVSMWNWILEEGLEDFDNYAQYGLPLFKATALKYGFPNPIGDKKGSEREFASS